MIKLFVFIETITEKSILLCFFVFLAYSSFSQKKDDSKTLKVAEGLFRQEKYEDALPIYLEHLKADTTNEVCLL